jgi:hypothetical protein
MTTQGGFGSAGAGNRTGRNIMTRGGMSTTPRENARRSGHPVTRPGVPIKEVLAEYIRSNRCWWCGADRTVDGRPFKSLSGHWRWAHGIDAQIVRDILLVSKRTSFITEDLKFHLSAEAKRRYDPKVLKGNHGKAHHLSAFGVLSQQSKLGLAREKLKKSFTDEEFRAKFSEAVSMAQGGVSLAEKECVVCKRIFIVKAKNYNRYATCGPECRSEHRRCRMLGRVVSEDTRKKISQANSKGDITKTCVICWSVFTVSRRRMNRSTCGLKTCIDALRLRNGSITEDGRRRISEFRHAQSQS